MSSATVPGAVSGHSDPQNDLHVELRHIRDLIFIRDLLRERGAASTELGEYDAVVDEAPTQWPKAGDLTVPRSQVRRAALTSHATAAIAVTSAPSAPYPFSAASAMSRHPIASGTDIVRQTRRSVWRRLSIA